MADRDNNDTDVRLVPVQETSCGLPLMDHIALALTALTTFGLGIACETEYQALLVIAETARQLHGHRAFDPGPEAEALVTRTRAAVQTRDNAEATPSTLHDMTVFPAPDNGQIH